MWLNKSWYIQAAALSAVIIPASMMSSSLVVVLLCGIVVAAARSTQDARSRVKRSVAAPWVGKGPTGYFRSPNYPSKYPLSTEKTYTIDVPDKGYYKVIFDLLQFNVEAQATCSWDYLLIDAGGIGKICGVLTAQTKTVKQTTSDITIKFYSDYMVSEIGFNIKYTIEKLPDACDSSPCHAGGKCELNGRFNFTCTCASGYSGNICQHYDPCHNVTCLNGGSCFRSSFNNASAQCSCPVAFTGQYCESKAPKPCESYPCMNNGTCRNVGYKNYTCICGVDYEGRNCQDLKWKPCDDKPCHNNGTCRNAGSNYTCSCMGDYYGRYCEYLQSKPCEDNPCQNNGTCMNVGSNYTCICNADYYGVDCEYSMRTTTYSASTVPTRYTTEWTTSRTDNRSDYSDLKNYVLGQLETALNKSSFSKHKFANIAEKARQWRSVLIA